MYIQKSWKNESLLFKMKESKNSFIIEEITSRKFPNYDSFNWEDMKYKRKYHGGYFIHNTQPSNIENIIREGLDMFSNKITYRSNYFLWAVNPEIESYYKNIPIKDVWTGYGGSSIIFHVPEGIHIEQLNQDQYGIHGRIPPEYIDSIDTPIFWDKYYGEMYRLSDLRELALSDGYNEFGKTPIERLKNIIKTLEESDLYKIYDNEKDLVKIINFIIKNF